MKPLSTRSSHKQSVTSEVKQSKSSNANIKVKVSLKVLSRKSSYESNGACAIAIKQREAAAERRKTNM